MGRPSSFSPEIAETICERLSGGEPLASICRDKDMPGVQTVSDWRNRYPDFSVSIARAREDGFDAIAIDALEIADDGSRDYTKKERPDGSTYEAVDYDHISRSKLRVETRLKLLAKWDPKRYGDKVALTGGAEGDAPIRVEEVRRTVVDPGNPHGPSIHATSGAGSVQGRVGRPGLGEIALLRREAD